MSKTVHLSVLDRVQIASPCSARWEHMTGDDRVRHCASCDHRVHNISGMGREEAEALLLRSAGGRLCVRLFRREDGTILTADCPVGVARIRAATRRALVRVAALIGLAGVAGVAAAATSRSEWTSGLRLRALKPFSIVCEWVAPGAAPPPGGRFIMGKMAAPMPMTPSAAPGNAAPQSSSANAGGAS